jgi:hypothetical protein
MARNLICMLNAKANQRLRSAAVPEFQQQTRHYRKAVASYTSPGRRGI